MHKNYHSLKVFNWHKIDSVLLTNLADNQLMELTIGGKNICVLRKGESFYAFTALCPHAGARLCEGWVDGLGRIVCPLHKYRFDPSNGRNTTGEGYKLFTYPVELRDGEIFVGLPENSF